MRYLVHWDDIRIGFTAHYPNVKQKEFFWEKQAKAEAIRLKFTGHNVRWYKREHKKWTLKGKL